MKTEELAKIVLDVANKQIEKNELTTPEKVALEISTTYEIEITHFESFTNKVASILAQLNYCGDFKADYITLTVSAYKKVSTYHKPLN